MSTQNDTEAAAVPVAYKNTAKLFADYPATKYNRLLPTLTVADDAGQLYKPKIELLKIDPKIPGYGESGEVYRDNRMAENFVALSRRGLQKLQHAAAIIFPPQLAKIELSEDRKSCLATSAGAMKKSDGSLLVITASKHIDLELEEMKIRDQHERKGKKAAELDSLVRRDLIQARENMVQNAETKAQNRVIRKVLALKDAYHVDDLKKPFVLIRFDQAFDIQDPAQLKLILANSSAASANLFPVAADTPAAMHQLDPSQEVTAEAEPATDPLDEAPEIPILEDEVATVMQTGYPAMKARFVKAVDALPLDAGAREKLLFDWRDIHNEPDESMKAPRWATLVLETERRAGTPA